MNKVLDEKRGKIMVTNSENVDLRDKGEKWNKKILSKELQELKLLYVIII